MHLIDLEQILHARTQKLASGLSLLCQIPLLEAEYQSSFPVFQAGMSERSRAKNTVFTYPLAFARMVSELTSRTFVPREAVDQRGAGLWNNFRAHLPNCPSDNVIGSLFEQAIQDLRKRYPYLFWQEIRGWRYVGPLLIHAGLPVQSVGAVLDALRDMLRWEPWQIDRLTGADIEEPLRRQRGLSKKYTVWALTDTEEGTLLICQFLRLARFVQDGGVLTVRDSFAFADPFVKELQAALARAPAQAPRHHTWQARLVWDPANRFLGWLVPGKGPWANVEDWTFVGGAVRRPAETGEMVGEVRAIRTGPEEILMDLAPSGVLAGARRIPRAVEELSDLMLFHNQTGHLLPWPQLFREGLVPGEYLALCRRSLNAEQLISPVGAVSVTETGVPLPGVWVRRYSGLRLEITAVPGTALTVQTGEGRKIRINIQGAASQTAGTMVLEASSLPVGASPRPAGRADSDLHWQGAARPPVLGASLWPIPARHAPAALAV